VVKPLSDTSLCFQTCVIMRTDDDVRDQGVGGSNPLSPTNSFKQLERFQHPQFWVQWVQLAISVPQWACGNRVPPVPP
jgi:hypothetical protein